MDKDLKAKLTATDKWLRVVFMVVYGCVNYLVQFIIYIIAVVQFVISLITGEPNENLENFSDGLSRFAFHIIKYLMYNTEDKPFPFADWPDKIKTEPAPKPAKKVKTQAKEEKEEDKA